MKNTLSFVALAAAILLFLFFLSSGKKAPFIPADNVHKGANTDAACVLCHAPGKQAPLRSTHPPKEQCLICHTVKKG